MRRTFIVVLACMLAGCQHSTQAKNKVLVRPPAQEQRDIAAVARDPEFVGLPQYALLAAAPYEDVTSLQTLCAVTSPSVGEWRREEELTRIGALLGTRFARIRIPGLGWQVWTRQDVKPVEAVIAFRGTDFSEWGDWYSNFRWITRLNPFTWDQYQQARDLTELLVDGLHEKYGSDLKIVTVGHSLGGGLAQHAAYSSSSIKRVYAFDASTVTGSSSLSFKDREASRAGLKIFRVYEKGEILAALRWAGRRVVPLSTDRPKVTEVRFNFHDSLKEKGFIGQHSMLPLACDLNAQL